MEGKTNTREEIVGMLVPSQLLSGANVNKLFSSADKTTGSGAALQVIPKRTSRVIRVEINSIDRNYSKFPLSSEFSWEFPFPVKEVKEVRLIGGTIPVPYLNIDEGWNKFTFSEGSTQSTITIPVGFYTVYSLITVLQGLLNSTGVGNVYTVSQDPQSGKIIITATGANTFYFLFATGSYKDTIDMHTNSVQGIGCPARLLGFGVADYTSSNGIIAATRAPNLWYSLERTYLYLNFDSSQDLRSIFRGSGRKEPSAIIYNDDLNTYNFVSGGPIPLTKFLNKETFDTNIVPAPASLSRIRNLNVSLRDMFYNLINTQGREVSLLLELLIVD
jgi:hypothetical protein